MTHLQRRRRTDQLDEMELEPGDLDSPRKLEVYTNAAAFYVSCLKSGYGDEATEFAEWFLETFDIDLEN